MRMGEFPKKKITWATSFLIIALFLSNILGMVRDRVLVTLFDTKVLSTYHAAFRIPDLIFNLLIIGALSSAIIPIFTSYLIRHQKEEAWHIINSIISLGFLATALFSFMVGIFAPYLIKIIVPGFDPERTKITINLTRLFLICPIFFGFSSIFGSVLNSFKKFFIYSLAPIFYNLGIIFGALIFSPFLGIYGVGLGVVLGAFLHMAIQIPSLISVGFRFRPALDFRNLGVKNITRLIIPRSLSLGMGQFIFLANTILGSLIGTGAIAIINLANNIQTLPTVVFGVAFATTLFPHLAEKAAQLRKESFRSDLFWGIRAILFFIIPASVGLILLRAQTVRLILGSYRFTWTDTMLTAGSLGVFSVSLFAQALLPLLSQAFFSFHDTKTPLLITTASVAFNIVLAFLFTRSLFNPFFQTLGRTTSDSRVIGLALAFSLASIFNLSLLFFYLQKKLGDFKVGEILASSLKIILASLIMALAVYGTLHLVAPLVDMTRVWGILTQTLVAIATGLVVYFGLASLLGFEEMKTLKVVFSSIKKRFSSFRKIK